jgi:microcystin degradation protein MlrC
MRIGVAQLWQETNTFNPRPTTRADFDQFRVLRGTEIVEQLAETNEPGGFIQSLRAWPEQPEIVGLVRLPAWPGGLLTRETFAWIRDEIVAALNTAGPLDGLLVALHGAMAADGHPDVEGEFLEAVRAVVGRDLPLVATLDLHANVTAKMFEHADVLVVYHTAPHIDLVETGIRGAGVLRRILIEEAQPVTAWVKLPMVPPVERANTQDPASVSFAWRERLQALEAELHVLSAGLATVQPWLDVPEFGTTAWITTVGDVDFAGNETMRLAEDVWNRRADYRIELATAADAVRTAHGVTDGLVVLSDAADATTSGAPGDSTWLLRELMQYDWPRGAAVTLVAPEVVEAARLLGA